MGNSWQSPVTGEPSHGTWHDIVAPTDANLLSQVVVAGTWYTVTFPVGTGTGKVPTGTTKVKATVRYYLASTTVNSIAYYRPYGSGAAVNAARKIASIYTASNVNSMSCSQIELPTDSSGRVEVEGDVSGPTLEISNAFAYSM